MKPAPFALVRAADLDEVLAALAAHGDEGRVIAGGQSLVPLMALRLAAPSVLIDLSRVPGLDEIVPLPGGGLRIGAMARQRRVETDRDVAGRAPLLAAAIPHIGHLAIRNQGTVGGSLAHADPAAELPAVALAAAATMHLRGASGTRSVAASDFFTGYYSTAVGPTEILEAVELPVLPPRSGAAFVEFSRRHGDFALVGAAATASLADDGTVAAARLVLSGVASTPWLLPAAMNALRGATAQEAPSAVGALVRAEVEPGDDLHASAAYRRHLAAVLSERALSTALARAAIDPQETHT